jgi:hypothetical protein
MTAAFASWVKRNNSLALYRDKTDELVRFVVSFANGAPILTNNINVLACDW